MLSQEKLIRITFYNGIKSILRRLFVCPALPCPARPCPPALPCPALPCPALPCPGRQCRRGARIIGPAPQRSISQRRDPGSQASPARRKMPSSSRGARIATTFRIGQGRPTQLWREGCLRPVGAASRGGIGTVEQHPGMDGDCQAEFPVVRGATQRPRRDWPASGSGGSRHSPPHVVPSNWTPTREGGLY